MVDLEVIRRGARIELARREFFSFCEAMAPDFYRSDRQYLMDLCGEMQDFYQSDDDILIVNEPHDMARVVLLLCWLNGYLDRIRKRRS